MPPRNRGRGRGPNGSYRDGSSRRRPNRRARRLLQNPNGNSNGNTPAYSVVPGSTDRPGLSIGPMPIFGTRTRRTLRYVANFIGLSSGAGTAGSYVFSANGLYDPDITGTGTQPKGFDQIMQFFYHYTVIRSRARVTFSSTSGVGPLVALAVASIATPLTSIESLMESGRCSTTWLTPVGIAGSKVTLTAAVNVGKYESKVNVLDDPNLKGTVAGNPAEQIYFVLYIFNPVDVVVVSSAVSVVIEYDAWFYEPQDLGLS